MKNFNYNLLFKQPILILIGFSLIVFFVLDQNVFKYLFLEFFILYSFLYCVLIKNKSIVVDSFSKYAIIMLNFTAFLFFADRKMDATLGNILILLATSPIFVYEGVGLFKKYSTNRFLEKTGVEPDLCISIHNDFNKMTPFADSYYFHNGLKFDKYGLVEPKLSYETIKKYMDDVGKPSFYFTSDDIALMEMQNI